MLRGVHDLSFTAQVRPARYNPPMPIRKLPPLLVNQIAAGEVIERAASVVKELVENSLDAAATRIDIQIEDGGAQLIRISDDGGGIAADELPLAVAPHATSKLQSPDQLGAIGTLGFRGEALASIASVARLRITSRPTINRKPAAQGATIEAAGDEVSAVAPAACAPGTVIEVRDLFFNTPARRKFMRAASTEFGHITDAVTRMAMVHHSVGFSLTHNGRKTMDVAPTTNRRRRCVELLGKELDEALLEFEEIADLASRMADVPQGGAKAAIWGLAGLPAIARATARFQYLCLNGRFIRDRQISHAIKEAYRGLVPPDRQPVAVVFLTMPPSLADVNVHPTKAEVRFREPGRVHGLVLSALRARLLGADLTPSAHVASSLKSLRDDEMDADAADAMPTGQTASPSFIAGASSHAAAGRPNDSQAFVDYFRSMAPMQKGFVYQQVRQAMAEVDPAVAAEPRDDEASATGGAASLLAQPSGHVPPVLRSFGVLQVHKSYLVTEDDHGILIIDQHALHERVMFEQLQQRILKGPLESQRLLMPVTLPGGAKRQALLEAVAPLLDRIGVEAEQFGPDSIAIHAFPTFLFDRKVDPAEFMENLLDRAEDGELDASNTTALEAALHEVLDMMSCKAAVKAGDKLTAQELAELLKQREAIERASNCPHGRPTTIRLTLRELEKQFKRT